MFCSSCGAKVPDNAKFCNECGSAIVHPARPDQPNNSEKSPTAARGDAASSPSGGAAPGFHTMRLVCRGCGSVMDVAEGGSVLVCPSCGSRELVVDDRDVAVEKIRESSRRAETQARTAVEMGRQELRRTELKQSEERDRLDREERGAREYRKGCLYKVTIVFVIVFALFCMFSFMLGYVLGGAILVIQVVLLVLSLLMGSRAVFAKHGRLYVIPAVAAILLTGLSFSACLGIPTAGRQVEEETPIVWSDLVMGDQIPQVEETHGDVWQNTKSSLWVDVEISGPQQYYDYVEQCKSMGYDAVSEETDSTFTAYNDAGAMLSIQYWDFSQDEMKIELTAGIEMSQIELPDSALAERLPQLPSNQGVITTDTESQLVLSVGGVDSAQFDAYVESCEERGFAVDQSEGDGAFSAFDDEGYELSLTYNEYSKVLVIQVDAPIEMGTLRWPGSGLAAKLPAPESTVGKIDTDSDSSFSAYVGDTTRDQYSAYVDACIAAGFDVDYSRDEDSMNGENKDEVKVDIDYLGNNTMSVRLRDYGL